MRPDTIIIRKLGLCDYKKTFLSMESFTQERQADTLDELWVLEHPPVFTQGQAGKPEHILAAGNIPIVQTNRGGQVTYHGPGQLVIYLLIDVRRLGIGIRRFVTSIETAIIQTLSHYQIQASSQEKAPGVYVDKQKICSIGLKVQRGCTYHGLALNVNMDLTPFSYINPCGFKNLKMTQISHFSSAPSVDAVAHIFCQYFLPILGYDKTKEMTNNE